MELKTSMTVEAWKILGIGSVAVWLFILLLLEKTEHSTNFLAALNSMVPSNLTISTINVPKFPQNQTQKKKKCDMFDGRWVYKPDENPSYDPTKCRFLEEKMSCKKNGRSDLAYEKWSWEAYDCDIPRLNGTDMVERLRNRRVILVGDSLNRNMWESLACILYSSIPSSGVKVQDKKSIPLIILTSKEYNFTIEFYWSPFLVEFNLNHESGKVLVLDKLSPNSKHWSGADIMVFNSGHWWAQTGKYRRWDFLQYKGKLIADMPIKKAYKLGMKTWRRWIEKNVNSDKTTVFFRSISTEHKTKKYDQWCYNKTKLLMDESYVSSYPESLVKVIENIVKDMSKPQVKYLNITKLTKYRIDAHPSMYRYKDWKNLTKVYAASLSAHADCTHWCLPGVPDTWNRLLYASLFFDSNLGE